VDREAHPVAKLARERLACLGHRVNLLEGLVDHQLLGIHHVKVDADGDPVVVLDVAFLVPGVLLLLVGSRLARSLNAHAVRRRAPR
jgi:uncharacterized membrane protein